MARKRMISPEIWESQDFSQLSDLAKIVFISLFSHADDEGRGRADPTFIKSSTFPYDENRRVADIKQALSEIALRMSVQFYSVNGIEFYFMQSWERWQKVDKPSKSKFPPPPRVGEGGDIPNRDNFHDYSPNIPRTFPEGSPPNRIERNRSNKRESQERKGAKAPALEDVKSYFKEKSYKSDPHKFYSYYDSREWLLDGKPIRKWQSLADLWESREKQFNTEIANAQSCRYTAEELDALMIHITDEDDDQ